MKKRNYERLFVILLIVCIMLLCTGCKSAEERHQESVESMNLLLEDKLLNYENNQEFEKYIKKHKDNDIANEAYDIYLSYLWNSELDDCEFYDEENGDYMKLIYAPRGASCWLTEKSKLEILSQVGFNEEQTKTLNKISALFDKLAECEKTMPHEPEYCQSDKYHFDNYTAGCAVEAYALKQVESKIEGYKLVIFTDCDPYWGTPAGNEYYCIYLDDGFDIRNQVYYLEDLYYIGEETITNNFEYEATVYFKPSILDDDFFTYLAWKDDYTYYRDELSILINDIANPWSNPLSNSWE